MPVHRTCTAYKRDTRVHVQAVSSVTQREGGHSDELEEVVLARGAPKSGWLLPPTWTRPRCRRKAGAKQARVWEVGIVSGTRLFRIGGLLAFVGALAFVLHVVLRSVLSAGVEPAVSAQAGLWVPLNALGAMGAALVLLGLPALYARMAGEGGLTGVVGFALIEVSWMFFGLFLSLYGALVLPWLADQTPRLVGGSSPAPLGFVVAFALGLLVWLVGAVLLAVPFMRGRMRPRWVGYVLPASGLWV